MGREEVSLALVAALVAGAGCATAPSSGLSAVPLVSGLWEGVSRSTISEGQSAGDTRIERQAWRLDQRGLIITGFYVVELTMISGDGRPYVCNQETRFTALVRIDVRGRIGKSGIELEDVSGPKTQGACRSVFRGPGRYRASLQGDVLTLVNGERHLALYRRPADEAEAVTRALLALDDGERRSVADPFGQNAVSLQPNGEPPANVEGYWVWEHRGLTPTGDEKLEREEWHLVQEGDAVSGYYDRSVRQISTDGHAYRCNSALDFQIVTRYQITGQVHGSAVVLHEQGFEIIEDSPCDDGRRRLDAYRGQAQAGEIRLMWGIGTQVLRRSRPSVPTQRF